MTHYNTSSTRTIVTYILLSYSWIYPTSTAQRNKIAKIVPLGKTSSSSSPSTKFFKKRKKYNQTKKSSKRHGSLDATDIQTFALPQISTIDATFFTDDNSNDGDSNLVFEWKDSSSSSQGYNGNVDDKYQHHHWYGEVIHGTAYGSMTLIQSLDVNDDTGDIISRVSGSAIVGQTVYSIIASKDGNSILVNSMNTTEFPSEKDDNNDQDPMIPQPTYSSSSNIGNTRQLYSSLQGSSTIYTHSNKDSLQQQQQYTRNLDDGTILDILCVYTLATVCQEAITAGFLQATKCNNTTYIQYKYLMDAKCQLAIAQSVRLLFLSLRWE